MHFARLAVYPMRRALQARAIRTYYVRPVLTPPLNTIQEALRGKHVSLGSSLNQHEVPQKAAARQNGFLLMKNSCSKPLTSEYFRYCMARRWPYIAIAKDGATVHVDLRSVAGPARITDENKVKKMIDSFQGVLDRTKRDVHFVNQDTLEEQSKLVTPGPREGSNDGKIRDLRISEVFTVHTTCRAEALELAAEFNVAFVTVTGAPTKAQLHSEKMERVAARSAAHRRLLLRRLTR
jgi:hypothetical protein